MNAEGHRLEIIQSAAAYPYDSRPTTRLRSVLQPLKLRFSREKLMLPNIVVGDLRGLTFGFAAVGNRQSDRGADLDVKHACVAVYAGPSAPPQVPAEVNHLKLIEPLAHHLAQSGVGLTCDEGAVGDEGDDAFLWCILRLEQFPNRPTPEGDGEFGEGVKLVSPSGATNGLLQVIPEIVDEGADDFARVNPLKAPVGRISDDRENALLPLDAIRLVALMTDRLGDVAETS